MSQTFDLVVQYDGTCDSPLMEGLSVACREVFAGGFTFLERVDLPSGAHSQGHPVGLTVDKVPRKGWERHLAGLLPVGIELMVVMPIGDSWEYLWRYYLDLGERASPFFRYRSLHCPDWRPTGPLPHGVNWNAHGHYLSWEGAKAKDVLRNLSGILAREASPHALILNSVKD
ncbi:MAG: hypothetical protein VXZ72_02065 [Chlamydiota bacterium]|nr:hypothetical protein [Chlamydiota bacterium]